jgi:RimJ/RimL family protein N-acetyltransferase
VACRDWALGELGWKRIVSLIARENGASIRVAEKIGETYERDVERPDIDYAIGLWSLGERSAA